jgi:hypothetical protein
VSSFPLVLIKIGFGRCGATLVIAIEGEQGQNSLVTEGLDQAAPYLKVKQYGTFLRRCFPAKPTGKK